MIADKRRARPVTHVERRLASRRLDAVDADRAQRIDQHGANQKFVLSQQHARHAAPSYSAARARMG